MDRQANTQFFFLLLLFNTEYGVCSGYSYYDYFTKKKKKGCMAPMSIKLFLDCLIEKSVIICFDKRMQVHRFVYVTKNLTPEI